MIVKLLTEHHLGFPSLTGGCTVSSESILVKMPHCWKSHAMAQLFAIFLSNRLEFLSDFLVTYSQQRSKRITDKEMECHQRYREYWVSVF